MEERAAVLMSKPIECDSGFKTLTSQNMPSGPVCDTLKRKL